LIENHDTKKPLSATSSHFQPLPATFSYFQPLSATYSRFIATFA
jgi:hypothetical protein